MPFTTLFERLLELPLFQGMSHNDLNTIVGQTKFGFHKVQRGKILIREGEACEHIYLLTSGKLCSLTQADDNSYSLEETIHAPAILQAERIFGLTQRYTKTFTAIEDSNLISINKQEVLRLSEQNFIFRLNLLNIISTHSQRADHQPWRIPPQSIRSKIIRFVESRSLRPAGTKTLHIKMETLASYIAESRLNVSHELRQMQRNGEIECTRGVIHIPALEQLIR